MAAEEAEGTPAPRYEQLLKPVGGAWSCRKEPLALKDNKKGAGAGIKPLSPEEENILKVGVSEASFHYLGSGKIICGIGKGFAEAVRVAKKNAAALTAAAGVKLGKLQQIDYGWSEVRIYDREASVLCEGDSPLPSCSEADIEPEDVSAEDNVTLVYEIEE